MPRNLRTKLNSRNLRITILLAILGCLAVAMIVATINSSAATPSSGTTATPTSGPTVLHMHGNPTDDPGTTGTGNIDVTLTTSFPALLGKATLGTGPAAHWDVGNPATIDGGTDRNNTAPDWVWVLSPAQGGPGPVNLGGDMAVQWWASCGACTGSLGTGWQIRVFADGQKKFDQRVTANRDNSNATPGIPKLHGATVFLHENWDSINNVAKDTTNTIKANNTIVLHIEPVFIDTENNTHIYYDSTSPCPSSPPSNTSPCDSQVTMPVLGATDPLPSPTPPPAPIPAATPGLGPGPRFQNYNPPLSFIAQGKGVDAGEPSLGVNWKTNKTMFISDLTTFRVTFNDACAATPAASWEDKSAPNNATSLDPILFTDHGYNRLTPNVGRTFVSELTGQDSLAAFTDDDGDTWIPSQGGGIPSGVDHQALGAGPYHAPLVGTVYANAVYYCSQDIATAFCARSDDGGATFGAAVPIYNLTTCGGLHGHPKVAPDGTVYVPNKSCLGRQAVVVSEDSGTTWSVRIVPNSVSAGSDPTVGIGSGGRVYLAFANGNRQAAVAVSDDRGLTWPKTFDVGASLGIQSTAFPEMVAGDNDRAAAAFLGSTTAGTPQVNLQDRRFPGVYNLIVATTYDGGNTWITTNATPNDVVQRGGIWLGGGSPVQRNLLDFMGMDIDRDGSILIAYADGCTGPACVQASSSATGDSYTEVATIARQTGGPRLFAGNDPVTPTVPGAPLLTVGRNGSLAHLTWSESDDGGSPITNFTVMRGTTSGGETFLSNAGAATSFDDSTADPNTIYFYRVAATSSFGTSCGTNEVKSTPVGDSQCSGLSVVIDPAGDQKGAPINADLDIREIRVADNVIGGKEKLTFTMKVTDLSTLLPDRQWRIIFSFPTAPNNTTPFTGSYYVGMNTDLSSATSFEYGTVTTVETVPVNTSSPNRIAAADGGSVDQKNGVITVTLSADKIGNPNVGDILGLIIGRTFAGNGNQTLRSNSAIDLTSGLAAQDPYTGASYRLAGNRPPVAAMTATPSSGFAPLTVNFSGASSSDPCDSIVSYTFDFGDGTTPVTQPGPTISHIYNAPGSYTASLIVTDSHGAPSTNVASVNIQVNPPPPPPTCIEDNDSRIAYSNGWHLINDASASDGHFRYHSGNSPQHFASLDFNVPAGNTGSISYSFAKSPKGGTADIYLDGVFQQTVNYAGSVGSTQAPEFKPEYQVQFGNLSAGAHKLEIKNLTGVVYVDRFCLQNSVSSAQPTTGPGSTTNQSSSASAGQTSSTNYSMPSGSQEISVVAESSLNLPFKLVLVNPSGLALQTVDASNGTAVLDTSVTQSGIYVIKVINVSLGPLQFTTTVTPLVSR